MAKHTVEHTCGHEQVHQIYGPHSDRENKLGWLETTLCTECWREEQQKERTAQSARDAEAAQVSGLPELIGSPKQIAWAETIRASFLKQLEGIENLSEAARNTLSETAQQEMSDAAILILSEIRDQKEARWWIDNRDQSPRRYFQEQFNARRDALCPTAVDEYEHCKECGKWVGPSLRGGICNLCTQVEKEHAGLSDVAEKEAA